MLLRIVLLATIPAFVASHSDGGLRLSGTAADDDDGARCTREELERQRDCILERGDKINTCVARCLVDHPAPDDTDGLSRCATACVTSSCGADGVSGRCASCFGDALGRGIGCTRRTGGACDDEEDLAGAACMSCHLEVGYEQERCMLGPPVALSSVRGGGESLALSLLAIATEATKYPLAGTVTRSSASCTEDEEELLKSDALFHITDTFFTCYDKHCANGGDVECVRKCVSDGSELDGDCAGCYATFKGAMDRCCSDMDSDECHRCVFRAMEDFVACVHGLPMSEHKIAVE